MKKPFIRIAFSENFLSSLSLQRAPLHHTFHHHFKKVSLNQSKTLYILILTSEKRKKRKKNPLFIVFHYAECTRTFWHKLKIELAMDLLSPILARLICYTSVTIPPLPPPFKNVFFLSHPLPPLTSPSFRPWIYRSTPHTSQPPKTKQRWHYCS